jgi:hypothetical protein
MYGEPCVEGSQTDAGVLGSRPDCPVPSGAPGCSAAIGLAVISESPANIVAHWTTENMDRCLLIFIDFLCSQFV